MRRGASRHLYSRWDGTQKGHDFDAERIFAEITDDLAYHGDVSAALRRLLHEGFDLGRNRSGDPVSTEPGRSDDKERVLGLRELIERIRERRQEVSETYDLGGAYKEIAHELSEIVRTELEAIERYESAAGSGDPQLQATAGHKAAQSRIALDLLPDDLAGRMRSLDSYEFISAEAARRFEELSQRLREEVAQAYFNQISDAISGTSAGDMSRLREAIDSLNTMIEQNARHEHLDPSFEEFMQRYGDLFPGNPTNLDELLEQLASRMAAVEAMFASMSSSQREQLSSLASQLLGDMDLSWQVDRLASNLRHGVPWAKWGQSHNFSGDQALGLADAATVSEIMSELDALEGLLSSTSGPGLLAEVDAERVRDLLGEEEAFSLGRLSEISRLLEEAGLISQREGRLELSAKGLRKIGHKALSELFSSVAQDRLGRHQRASTGLGHERDLGTKPYEFGDPFNLDIGASLRSAVARSGPGTPVAVTPEDFEVDRTEQMVRASTVLALDLSLSMPMRDNFLPAKKLAMALQALISSQFPNDYLGMVGFGEVAREIAPRDLPSVSWDLAYGTNLAHALALSRRMLSSRPGSRQIIVVTDGEPTAHVTRSGEVFFNYPPVPETLEATLAEVLRCTKDQIVINTFALDTSGYLRSFLEQMSRINAGRVFFTTPETLGDFVLVDFVEHRRSTKTSRSR